MIGINIEMPNCCDECPLFVDYYDYPTCKVDMKSSGYNFPIKAKRMDFCPLSDNETKMKGDRLCFKRC